MFRSIAFYIGEKTLDMNGHAFPLGELTVEVLNITPDEYHKLRRILTKAVRKMANYEKSQQMQDWFDANEQMIKLHRSLVRHRVFQLLQETEGILSEARVLTGQYSLFQEPEDLEPTDRDLEIAAAIGDYEDYLEHPEEYGGDDFIGAQLGDGFYEIPVPRPPIPPEPPDQSPFDLSGEPASEVGVLQAVLYALWRSPGRHFFGLPDLAGVHPDGHCIPGQAVA